MAGPLIRALGKDGADGSTGPDPFTRTRYVADARNFSFPGRFLKPRPRVSYGKVGPGEDYGFADGAARFVTRSHQIEFRQRSSRAGCSVCLKDGKTVGALDQFHGGTPAGIDFNWIQQASAIDEVDTVDAYKIELLGRRRRKFACLVDEHTIPVLGVLGLKDVSAVPVAICPEYPLADELAEYAQRHRSAPGRNEYDRSGSSLHSFLEVGTSGQGLALMPWPHTVAASGRLGLDQPGPLPNSGAGLLAEGRHGVSLATERFRDHPRIPNAAQHPRGVSPQPSAGGQRGHFTRMIFKPGQVNNGIALDVSSGTGSGVGRKISWGRQCSHRGMLVEIDKRVNRRHSETRKGR